MHCFLLKLILHRVWKAVTSIASHAQRMQKGMFIIKSVCSIETVISFDKQITPGTSLIPITAQISDIKILTSVKWSFIISGILKFCQEFWSFHDDWACSQREHLLHCVLYYNQTFSKLCSYWNKAYIHGKPEKLTFI